MNKVCIIGNLTKDPETRYTTGQNPMAVCRFSIAVNDGYGDKQKTNYPNVVVFGKTAESCDKYLGKGSKVAIEGRIQTGSYEGRDGKKVYTTDIVADRVDFLTYREGNENQNNGGREQDYGGFYETQEKIPFA